jgi:flagellar basal-body rod protein FlgB
MTDATAAITLKALDGLSLRAVAIAQNIANASTPSYRPVRVSFEQELRQAVERGSETMETWQPHVEIAPRSMAQEQVRLDLELAQAADTAGRYAALVDVLGRQMHIASLAVSGSR